MSIRAMNAVWEHSRSKGAARLVLLAIADHTGDDGTGAFPGYERLVKKTRLSERGIRGNIRELEVDLQELVVAEHPDDRRRNIYSVRLPGLRAYEEIPAKIAGVPPDPESRASDQPKQDPIQSVSETPAKIAAIVREQPADVAGDDEPDYRQIDVAKPATDRADTGKSARAYKEEPPGTKSNLPVGAPDGAADSMTPDDWNAFHVLSAVIKPDEKIPGAIKARLGAEIKKLAKDHYPFDLVCKATRKVLDDHKSPTALPLVVMDLANGSGSRSGHRPWQAPAESAYAGPVR